MLRVVLIAALVACAVSQFVPQTGPLTVNNITSGVHIAGTAAASTSEDTSLHVTLYQFWVPENTSVVNVTFTLPTGDCSYLNFQLSTFGLPCNNDEYDTSYPSYPCALAWDIESGANDFQENFTPYDSNYLYQFVVNKYWYFAVGKWSSSDYQDTCAYGLDVTIQSSCPVGQVATQVVSSTSTQCVPYTALNGPNYAIPARTNFNADGTMDFTQYKLNVTQNTGNIYVWVNSTSNDIDMYGRNYAGAGYYGDNNCETTTYTTSAGGFYIYEMWCFTPRAGSFFLSFETDDTGYSATFMVTAMICPAGKGGYNCTYNSTTLANATLPTTLTFANMYNSNVGSASYTAAYWYIDIAPNSGGNVFVISATSPDSGYLMFRRDGYPTMDSESGYEYSSQYVSIPTSTGNGIALSAFDWQVPGRIYIAAICYESTDPCSITLDRNSTGTITGPVTSVTGNTNADDNDDTTGNDNTDNDDNNDNTDDNDDAPADDATIALPSFVTIVAALAISLYVRQ
eukprot:TRINITY_DN13_c0_g1_i1.p1 TRINITY_DN13_c0_g1~~TRINITY_DN13_c0_g1_i1.p1  ORF type:complete len:512 (-),score=133.31 TRINITY_DN13_c0_g1_i1:98-1633(-)